VPPNGVLPNGGLGSPPELFGPCPCSLPTLELRTLSGRDSRLPPKTDDGASARTEALVSRLFRRRRFDDDARVRMDASSDNALFAVAVVYVFGCPGPPVTCAGIADAGLGVVGKGWLNWLAWENWGTCPWFGCTLFRMVFGAVDWIVVRVVVIERTEGAGDEKVLPSPPASCVLMVPPPVVTVPALDLPVSEFMVPGFVAIVGAMDFAPRVRETWSSAEVVKDCRLSGRRRFVRLRPAPWIGIKPIVEFCPSVRDAEGVIFSKAVAG